MLIRELIEGLKFQGRLCTKNCSGHKAGWKWAKTRGVNSTTGCTSRSPSFTGGCEIAVNQTAAIPRIRDLKGKFARPA
jgi:hypothetical protein